MLFDLRSRGRRRTVQAVYLGLAVLMGGGLVLFGVGAGNGFGGILNAFTGGGGGNAAQVVSQEEKTALKATQLHPTDPNGWASLVKARWQSAKQANDQDPTTGAFTTAGRKELTLAADAWQHYVALTNAPDSIVAQLAARSYAALGDYAHEAAAWETFTLANPTEPLGFECLAASAYTAKQTRKGDLATAKALSLVPKASRASLQTQLLQAKTNPQIAQTC